MWLIINSKKTTCRSIHNGGFYRVPRCTALDDPVSRTVSA